MHQVSLRRFILFSDRVIMRNCYCTPPGGIRCEQTNRSGWLQQLLINITMEVGVEFNVKNHYALLWIMVNL